VGLSNVDNPTAGQQVLTLEWNGSSWSQITAPNPVSGTIQFGGLPAIDCADASDCWIVGTWGSSTPQDFVLQWNGTAWSVGSVPTATTPYDSTALGSIACTSASNCWAVGTESSSTLSPVPQAFIVQWNGTSWSTVSAPTAGGLDSVTCTSSSACWAVGPGPGATGGAAGTLLQWGGSAWSAVSLPGTNTGLNAVGCGASSNCWIAGVDASGSSVQSVSYQWDGTAWTAGQLPQPQAQATPLSIACSGSDCWTLVVPTTGAAAPKAYAEFTDGTTSGTPVLAGGGVPLSVQGPALGADGLGGGSALEACQCGGQGSQTGTVDPVDAATGDNYSTATDLTVPGAGVPLTFTRTYDAQSAQAEITAGASAGPLGFGWSYNLGASISYDSSTQVATVTEGNGAQDVFDAYSSSTSPAWCSNATNFCATSPRTIATLNQNGGGSWTLVNNVNSPITSQFDSSGALTAISDAQGDSVTAAPGTPGSGQCPSASSFCTVWTSSASGRALTLAFNATGQLTQVADPGGNAATFCYYTQSCASGAPSGGGQATDLYTATDPGSLTTAYTYDASNSTADLQRDVLTVSPPGAGEIQNTYTAGQVTAQQNNASGQLTTFSFSGSPATLSGGATTVTTYPQGTGGPDQVDTYTYSSGVMLSDETTNSSSSTVSEEIVARDPVSLLSTDVEDPNQNLSAQALDSYDLSNSHSTLTNGNATTASDAVGNITLSAYNSFNQPWCTVDAADHANGALCPSSPPTAPPSPGASDPDLGMAISYYNGADLLTATTDALGNTTTYVYTSGVSGVPNRLMYCSVDPVAYQAGVTCPTYAGSHVTGTTTHTFDSAGDSLTSTDADGGTTTDTYSSTHPGLVATSTDPDGTMTTYNYDATGQVTSQVVTFGSYSATTAYAYDSSGRKYCEVDPYEYALGVRCPTSPPSASSPPAGVTSTFYDSNGRVDQTTNAIGGTTLTAYDAAGNKFCEVDPRAYAAGKTCPTSPPTGSSIPTPGSDSYLGMTIDTYNALEQLVQDTSAIGGITVYSYDDAGNKIEQDVESNDATHDPTITTDYQYDADNRVVETTVDPGTSLTATTLQSYDPNGNVYCSVSANAVAGGSYQCPPWQATWITSPPSPLSLYSSSPSPAQANDVTTTFSDANGDQVQSTDPDVQSTISAFDGDGRTYCDADATNTATWLVAHSSGTYPYLCPGTAPSTAPTGTTGYTTTIFDAAGHTLSSTDQVGDTTSYTYDPAGHQLTMVDPRGETTTSCYYWANASGQCASSAPAGGGSGDDLYSQLTPVTSADPTGELTTTTYYPGDTTDVTTTPAGSSTDAYDANGDLTSTTYSGTASGYSTPHSLTDTYNPDGTKATMADGTGTTTYSYDYAGDMTSQALVATGGTGLANKTTSRSYFSTGVVDTETYPAYGSYSSPTVTYAYDGTGAMVSETDWLGKTVTFAHDADGNQTSQDNAVSTSNPSGTSSTSFSYDAADQNTQASSTLAQTCSGSNETLTQSFSGTGGSRNPDGQVTQDSESYTGSCSSPPPYQRNYSYDAAGRVVYQGTVAQGSSANTFIYDASGDPTTMSNHDSSGNFDTYTQSYDAAGEVTGQTPVSGSAGVTSTYSYDTLGAQTQAVAGSSTSNYSFNQTGQMTTFSQASSTSYQYNGDGLEAGTTYPGYAWSAASSIDSAGAITAVTCPSTSFCIAVDDTGHDLKYNGTTWFGPVTIDGTNDITAVSCYSSTECMAVDDTGHAISYSGTWASPSLIDSGHSLQAVSCVYGFCAIVDNHGRVLTISGLTWTTTHIDGTNQLQGISCTSSSFCEAFDTLGNVLKKSGASWTTASNVDSHALDTSVSCASTSFCAAVDFGGYVLTYNGSSWSTPSRIDTNGLTSISCTTSTFCDATDPDGNVVTYNGTAWSSLVNVDSTHNISSVSCPATTSCTAVDGSGDVLYYKAASVTSQLTWDTSGSLATILSDGTNDFIYGPSDTPIEQVNITPLPPTANPQFMTYTDSDSSWLMTSASGDETAFWRYDAFGNLAFGTPGSPFGYAGQYQDTSSNSSGFYNMRARWYEPQTGSFSTRDPQFARSGQGYSYTNGDPVNGSDPTGQSWSRVYGGGPKRPKCDLGRKDCKHATWKAAILGISGAQHVDFSALGIPLHVFVYNDGALATQFHVCASSCQTNNPWQFQTYEVVFTGFNIFYRSGYQQANHVNINSWNGFGLPVYYVVDAGSWNGFGVISDNVY